MEKLDSAVDQFRQDNLAFIRNLNPNDVEYIGNAAEVVYSANAGKAVFEQIRDVSLEKLFFLSYLANNGTLRCEGIDLYWKLFVLDNNHDPIKRLHQCFSDLYRSRIINVYTKDDFHLIG